MPVVTLPMGETTMLRLAPPGGGGGGGVNISVTPLDACHCLVCNQNHNILETSLPAARTELPVIG